MSEEKKSKNPAPKPAETKPAEPEVTTPDPKPADTVPPESENPTPEEIEKSELLDVIEAQATTIKRQEELMNDLTGLVTGLKERIEAQEADGEVVERESDVFVDPFDTHNALKFKKDHIDPDSNFEYGRKLKWINPKLRDDIGPKGWVPVRYGDSFLEGEVFDPETGETRVEMGAKLSEYLEAVPTRMEGNARRDDYVRRGDLILAWIDMITWIARMRNRDEVAMKKRIQLSNEGDVYDIKGRRGAHVLGPGLTRGSDPRQQRRQSKPYMPPNLDPGAGNLSVPVEYIPTEPTPSPEE